MKDFFVVAPIRQPIDFHIVNLVPDTEAVRGDIENSCETCCRYGGTRPDDFCGVEIRRDHGGAKRLSFRLVNNCR